MATIPMHFSATVQDGLGVKKSTDVYVAPADTTTLAQVVASIGTWLSDLDAVTDGAIIANQVRIVPALPGGIKALSAGSVASSRNGYPGRIRFSITGTARHWTATVPALATGSISAGKPNTLGASMATFISLLLSAGGGYVAPSNDALTAFAAAFIGENKARKQLQPKSTV